MFFRKLFLFVLLVCVSPVFSQDLSESSSFVKGVPMEIQSLEMAGRLVSYGYQTKSALPLIQAVQIFQRMNVVDVADSTNLDNRFSETRLLSDATKFADGNKNLLSLINDVCKSTRSAGGLGPLRYYGRLEPGETRYCSTYVTSGKFVQIVVDGQGEGNRTKDAKGEIYSADLQLTVYDGKMRTIAKDHSSGVNCVACFYANDTSNLSIEIKNIGQLPEEYVFYIYK